MTDTVGFIDNLKSLWLLPNNLDEVDLPTCLIVIDSSHNIDHQIETVENSLQGIDVEIRKFFMSLTRWIGYAMS